MPLFLNFIINYLQSRTQVVNINGVFSTERNVSSGVIQGSVLGPIFFSIFINDVDEHIVNSKILKYADDIRIYRIFESTTAAHMANAMLFQKDIDAMAEWSNKWDLKFNLSKCCVLHFGRSNPKTKYKLGDFQVDNRCQESDLGVLFSDKFNFNDHMDSIIKKANKKLGIIAHVFRNKNAKILIPLYKTFVRPLLEYNSVIWSPSTSTYIEKIEKIQKKMFRLMSDYRDMPYKTQLLKANLLSLHARRIQHQLVVMFKMKNNLIDLRFHDFFKKNKFTKTRGNRYKLMIPKSKLKLHASFFTNACVRHWNRLKSSEIEALTCDLFKKNVVEYFKRVKIW